MKAERIRPARTTPPDFPVPAIIPDVGTSSAVWRHLFVVYFYLLTHQAAVARISALTRANRRVANPPKDFPAKQRGKKAAAAAEENAIELD